MGDPRRRAADSGHDADVVRLKRLPSGWFGCPITITTTNEDTTAATATRSAKARVRYADLAVLIEAPKPTGDARSPSSPMPAVPPRTAAR